MQSEGSEPTEGSRRREAETATAPPVSVGPYLRRVRRRAFLLLGARSMLTAFAAGSVVFLVAAWTNGPLSDPFVSLLVWILTLGAAAAGAYVGGAMALRRHAASWLASAAPDLVSPSRSALEFDDPERQASPELVAAHRVWVERRLAAVPIKHVVPLRVFAHATTFGALGTLALIAAAFLWSESARDGAFALTHPYRESDDGVVFAAVVRDLKVEVNFPAYQDRPPATLGAFQTLELPRGSSVRLSVQTRLPMEEGLIALDDSQVALRREGGGLGARFVARRDARLRLKFRHADGRWFEDPTLRTLRVVADETPSVRLTAPRDDLTVAAGTEVPFAWEARDDLGLRSVDLVVQTMDGQQIRRRLETYKGGIPEPDGYGHGSILTETYAVRPGDDLVFWIEAEDGDTVSGPKRGQSLKRTIRIASEALKRAALVADLEEVLSRGLDALGDRLEWPAPNARPEAAERLERLRERDGAFAEALDDAGDSAEGEHVAGTNAAVFSELAQRIRRGSRRESKAHQASSKKATERLKWDAKQTEELERGVLLLSDLVNQAKLEDAAAITQEIENLRREMVSLLKELRRTDAPEAKQALLSAIQRTRARLAELMARLAAMAEDVPQEFVNLDALATQQKQADALDALQKAVQQGDLDAAEAQLAELERQINSMAQALSGGAEAYAEARFGPRERAMAEAMDRLAGLETEQRQLAQRTMETRRGAAERAIAAGTFKGEGQKAGRERLARRAEQLGAQLKAMDTGRRHPADAEAMQQATQRLKDVADALRSEDLAEARRMAEAAQDRMDALARDLDLSALMFPGAQGQATEAARSARRTADDLAELTKDIDHTLPRVGDYVNEGGRRQMRQDQTQQKRVKRAADDLAQRFEDAPDGNPLSPETAQGLQQLQDTMDHASRALGEGDPIEASRQQQEVARALTELREKLERQQRQNQGGGGGGGSDGQRSRTRRAAVRIPGAEDFEAPEQARRRLLDAMRERAPSGYEDAIRRYYQELLR